MKYAVISAGLLLGACTGTVPATYTPQSIVKIGAGSVEVGDFSYAPAKSGDVEPNQLQNTAMGRIVIGTNISDFVRRATALEMERSGLTLANTAPYRIEGDVQKFMADDLGYSVDWSYSIRYRLTEAASGRDIINQTYTSPTVTTGKFGMASDYTSSLNQMIIPTTEQFMDDMRETGLFAAAAAPS